MRETKRIHSSYTAHKSLLDDIITNFDTKGQDFGNQDRNALKLFDVNGVLVNVKSFRIPNLVNQVAYKFFRKSKAERSFEYANKLQTLNIGTPQPIAYYELKTFFLFKKSYYISEQLECDLTYRELTKDLEFPHHEEILRAFTRFTHRLHEKNIKFLDHSPGNTLIKKNETKYEFYLVDLNRMEFKTMDLNERVKNFAKLTTHRSMIETMSDEYAKCCKEPYEKIFKLMWEETQVFQNRYQRKRQLKHKFKFWKKKRN